MRYARRLAEAYVTPHDALQTILGHADIKMTLRYAHLAPDHLRSEMSRTERNSENVSVLAQASA
jgi:integrase